MRFFLVILLILTGCIHSSTEKEKSPKSYFDKALQYKEQNNYIKALDKLSDLRKEFFYSSYNQKALLLTADIYFAQNKYPQAVQSYKKHLNLYPEKQKDYVLYQIGLSYKNQLPHRPEHDLSLATPALKVFNTLINLKSSSYKQKAKKEKQDILDKKAAKELKTVLFFKSQGWNKASFKRVQYFIKNYSKSPLMPKVLLTAFQLATVLGENSEKFKNQLIKNYPESQEVKAIHTNQKDSIFSQWKEKLL